jgi:chloramphenicol 3-O phosphotransferase
LSPIQPASSGHIIFINGIPNAGKTTLAGAVQHALDEPYWHLSLDDFLRGYTDRHWLGPSPPSFTRIMDGYLRSLRQFALCGNNIVAEAVITPNRVDTYLELFGDLPVLLVGIHISLDEAHRRERQRTDRLKPYDVTASDIEWVHAHGLYDLELDTSKLAPDAAAAQVLGLVAAPPSPTAFQKLLERQEK